MKKICDFRDVYLPDINRIIIVVINIFNYNLLSHTKSGFNDF